MPIGSKGGGAAQAEYEKENGFYSAPTTIGAAATALYTTTTTPARTSGQSVTVYTILVENSTGAAGTAWLEIGGTRVTPEIHVADQDTVKLEFATGLTLGDNDINVNGTQNLVVQIVGLEA